MKEKLVIKNFGPIKSVELELSRFNVLIGEQGTGKSLVAKLLEFLSNRLFLFGSNSQRSMEMHKSGLFFDSKMSFEYSTNNFNVIYQNEEFTVEIVGENKEFLTRYKELFGKIFSGFDSTDREEFDVLGDKYDDEILVDIYIPAERIAIKSMSDSSIDNRFKSSDKYLREFFINYNAARKNLPVFKIPHLDNVTFTFENDSEELFIGEDRVPLYLSSTGYQVSIPLVVSVEYLSLFNSRFILEEPELSLFPKAQNSLMQYLVNKTVGTKNSMLLTTHSPYILTSLNNMMYAYQIGQNHNEVVSTILDKKYWINPEDVSAYMMLEDGTCENILDRKEGMINAEKIDGISGVLNKQFDQLIEIEHNDIA